MRGLVSTNIGDPPSPGPIDACESSICDWGTFPKDKLRGMIGVEFIRFNAIILQKIAVAIFSGVIWNKKSHTSYITLIC